MLVLEAARQLLMCSLPLCILYKEAVGSAYVRNHLVHNAETVLCTCHIRPREREARCLEAAHLGKLLLPQTRNLPQCCCVTLVFSIVYIDHDRCFLDAARCC
jgi:hypothetical protein